MVLPLEPTIYCYTFPHLERMIREIHRMGVPVMLHSCGYQMPFLESYVDAGLDVLQSFQPMAGNDFEAAFAEFGRRLTFATGIDTQQGEWMTSTQLRNDILRYCEIGASGGRFILAMTHMLQHTMPLDNIRTILETIEDLSAQSAARPVEERICACGPGGRAAIGYPGR